VGWDYAIVGEDGTEHQWFIKPDLKTADPYALRVGRFYERTAGLLPAGSRKQGPKWSDPDKAAAEIACLLNGAVLLGHNVRFDEGFFGAFLLRHGQVLTADHHQIDTWPLVTGWIAGQRAAAGGYPMPAWPAGKHLADLAGVVGIDPQEYDQHTALGDARLAYATYRAVMGKPS
jgi:DNA polymerase III epsilon subunit-like protein